MAKPKLTPAFPVKINPAHEGPYQVRCHGWIAWNYSLWEGGMWHGTTNHGPGNAVVFGRKFGPTSQCVVEWRGLAHKPK